MDRSEAVYFPLCALLLVHTFFIEQIKIIQQGGNVY